MLTEHYLLKQIIFILDYLPFMKEINIEITASTSNI